MAGSSTRFLLIFLSVTYCLGDQSANIDCARRDYDGGTVCVCNATYCDEIQPLTKLNAPNYQVFTSNKAGLRFKRTTGVFEVDDHPPVDLERIVVHKNDKYQTMFGWGGAFTDAFGIQVKSLDAATQNKLLRSYFSKSGIEYNVGRVPVGGTDFSTKGYSYDDSDTEDVGLNHFSLVNEDYNYKIPVIREALNLNNELKLLASAWIAPKWMKTNGAYSGFGRIKDDMYQVWADYHMKFFDAYKKENVTFWAVTTGNEPSLGLVGSDIPSSRWLPNEMQRWIGDHLGPTIRNSQYKDLKIMVLDDQRVFVPWYIDYVFSNKTVKDFVDMIAIHWYWDDVIPVDVLNFLNDKYPDKPAMGTEACVGDRLGEKDVDLGSWHRGERYASSVLEDVNHHFIGWMDWNMALDTTGGPTYISNNVDSPIIVNATAGEFYKQPMYYSLGHFSKFVPRGSIRIGTSKRLLVSSTAFIRPDNATVVILQNKGSLDHDVNIVDSNRGKISLTLSADSLTTVVYY